MNPAEPASPDDKTVVVVMGVAGSGKTTIGQILAVQLGWRFADADQFHPAANVAKMASGTPLTDEDRWPWLETIRAWIDADPGDAVVACSALRRRYRDVLSEARAQVRYLYLDGTVSQLQSRLSARTDHFMLATMLTSQLNTLEPLTDDENGVVISIMQTPQQIVDQAINALRLRGTPADA